MTMLLVEEVSKRYATADALDRVSLTAATGEFLTLIGPSGCGKSTMLACIAGLVPYDGGEIRVGGRAVTGPLAESAVVFQQASLLPWRPVGRNVEYGLELAGIDKRERRSRARQALAMVGLGGQADRLPHELSGGMQQRVNLARALAMDPELLLLDEPFGALDAITKERLQDELLRLTAREDRTTVFITHDVEEAVFLADRVLVMSAAPGRIMEAFDVPLARPRSRRELARPAIQELILRLRSMLAPQTSEVTPP
jgi:NitT/TauT family transport system ATP-binding protein